jgi:hypothetical protein
VDIIQMKLMVDCMGLVQNTGVEEQMVLVVVGTSVVEEV